MKLFSKLLVASAVGLAGFPSASLAEGLYLTGSVGTANYEALDLSTDESPISYEFNPEAGINYDLGFGYDFGNTIRVEATWEYSESHDVKAKVNIEGFSDGGTVPLDTNSSTYLATVYKDFETESKLTPFVGVSIGTSTFEFNEEEFIPDFEVDSFVYGAQAGVSYQVSEKLDVLGKLSYLMHNPDDQSIEGERINTDGLDMLSAKLGMRFSF